MLTWIREKFGKIIISVIISLIAAVFIFSGVFSRKSTRGIHEGAVAGTVNGDPITLGEFNDAYRRQVEFFKNLGGGQFDEDQMEKMGIRYNVFQQLVRKKVMLQEAAKIGLHPSEEEIRDKIAEIPAFQKDGKFDLASYKAVLAANNYSPGGFERMVREDLSSSRWQEYFKDRIHFSTDELKDEFVSSETKRNIKYVMVTAEAARKAVKIDDTEIAKYLSDEAKLALVKTRFESRKELEFKGKTLDQVKTQIARDLLAGEKLAEVGQAAEKLAAEIAPLLTADKGSDAKVAAQFKTYGLEARSTGLIARQGDYIPGMGTQKDLVNEAFGVGIKQAKVFKNGQTAIVAVVIESKEADFSKFDKERPRLIKQVVSEKERALMDDWLKKATDKSKVEENPEVVGRGGKA